jgi:3-methyladenine DNA glycosylase/8-oxoguanine DNA glycosylase
VSDRFAAARVEPLTVDVVPPWPFKLPRGSGGDATAATRGGILCRLLHVDRRPVLVRAWQPERRRVYLCADALAPESVVYPSVAGQPEAAGSEQLELAIKRMRFAIGVDDDYSDFHRRFRDDPLLRPLIHRYADTRPRRRPWLWEALAWAVTKQLIESSRAAAIQRRIVRRWGPRVGEGRVALGDVPAPAVIAGRAPAELESMDLSGSRSVALRRVAHEVAVQGCPLEDPSSEELLKRVPGIGPWTVQCLGLYGRGDLDSLPAGDLGYVKLIGRLSGNGRRATVEEVEEFYAPYAPYRGLAGELTLRGLHKEVAKGPPLRAAA